MPALICNLPAYEVWVRKEYLLDHKGGHGEFVKGGEEDNVVLLTDLTTNTNRSYLKQPDDETRLFYVGATRTKENLHIIRPKDYDKSFPMEDYE